MSDDTLAKDTDVTVAPQRAGRHRSGPSAAPAGGGGRDRYLDMLRCVALVRVVTYHAFVWPWLSLVFPSMGVMFALAGSLMARSLDRPALSVLRGRLRRLLPPLWLFGAVIALAMMLKGWAPEEHQVGRWWARMLLWVVPVADPPHSAWGFEATEILWYLRTYLWFVLLSPLLLWAFRRAPAAVLCLSAVPIVVFTTVWTVPEGQAGTVLLDLATYLACWMAGFAHRDGLLDRLRPALAVSCAALAMAVGGWWAFGHRVDGSYDLNEIPPAQAFWSVGFVLLLLRFRPRLDGPARIRALDRLVVVCNSRAITIYLWHQTALILSVPAIDHLWHVRAFELSLPLGSMWFQFGVAWMLIAVAVALFGWVEDLAAKREPRLLPSR
ncbi:acyltransferase [Streptomyces sparsogenes]|uniref:acyltransferase family protein n=1 Tax=Streptomyces sparsogenes TaxID=67365 RepID=UPI00340F92A1